MIDGLKCILVFLIGLFVGSFLSVLIDRFPRDESVIGGRSHCDKCKRVLEWYDLIPLFSFIFLRGRCRYCHTPLSFYYPVVEMTTGVLFVAVLFFLGGFTINVITIITIIYYLFIISSLIVVFFTDLKYGIIPDKIVFPAIIISFLYFILYPSSLILPHLLSGTGAFAFFLLLFFINSGKGMGFGDVKFVFMIGLILGFPNIAIAFYIAFLTGALWGGILIIWRRKRLLGTRIPFGPFLVVGTILALFFGEQIRQVTVGLLLL